MCHTVVVVVIINEDNNDTADIDAHHFRTMHVRFDRQLTLVIVFGFE